MFFNNLNFLNLLSLLIEFCLFSVILHCFLKWSQKPRVQCIRYMKNLIPYIKIERSNLVFAKYSLLRRTFCITSIIYQLYEFQTNELTVREQENDLQFTDKCLLFNMSKFSYNSSDLRRLVTLGLKKKRNRTECFLYRQILIKTIILTHMQLIKHHY